MDRQEKEVVCTERQVHRKGFGGTANQYVCTELVMQDRLVVIRENLEPNRKSMMRRLILSVYLWSAGSVSGGLIGK